MMMPWHVFKPDLMVATSIECGEITRVAFGLDKGNVAVTGYPRNDVLFDGNKSVASPSTPLPASFAEAVDKDRKVILYLPTYRDSGKSYMNMEWDRLDELMESLGATFFFKTHPVDRLKNEISCKNVCQLPQLIDVYDLLPRIDILISDYSSIVFDFMLLNRPIVYYTPDLEEFLNSSRALNFHPKEIAVGPMCESFPELLTAIEKIIQSGAADFDGKRKDVFPRLHGFRDGRASERVLAVISDRYFDGALVSRKEGEILLV